MEQLKSHLRAGRQNRQLKFISDIHLRFLSSVIDLIVLPTFSCRRRPRLFYLRSRLRYFLNGPSVIVVHIRAFS